MTGHTWAWALIFGIPLAVFTLAGVEMWRDRRRAKPCSHYERCPECQ
jgi:uncharacterized iron-regulated membrane protein